MNIIELFKIIENSDLPDNINGEFELHKKYILWRYDINNSIDSDNENEKDYYSDDSENEFDYGFDSISNEEILLDIHNNDLDQLELFLDEINEIDNFNISDPNIKKSSISFKIM